LFVDVRLELGLGHAAERARPTLRVVEQARTVVHDAQRGDAVPQSGNVSSTPA
jgi:hypothetical protein